MRVEIYHTPTTLFLSFTPNQQGAAILLVSNKRIFVGTAC